MDKKDTLKLDDASKDKAPIKKDKKGKKEIIISEAVSTIIEIVVDVIVDIVT